jgi:hypothetical protein
VDHIGERAHQRGDLPSDDEGLKRSHSGSSSPTLPEGMNNGEKAAASRFSGGWGRGGGEPRAGSGLVEEDGVMAATVVGWLGGGEGLGGMVSSWWNYGISFLL